MASLDVIKTRIPTKKDTNNWEMVGGLDENGDAQELSFTDDRVNTTTFIADSTDPSLKAKLDKTTLSFQTIDYPHHEIHSGSHFFIEGYATLATNTSMYVKLVTPDTARWGHFVWEINSSAILESTLKEDATGGMTGGLRTTIHANNRNVNCWTGRHTGANNAAVLTDSTKSWTVDELIGFQVFNTLDGSSGFVASNTADTVTLTSLTGGTDNDFDTNDEYEINRSGFIITSGVIACTDYIQLLGNIKFGSKSGGGAHGREDEIILKRNTVYCRNFTSRTANNIVNFKATWYEHTNTV